MESQSGNEESGFIDIESLTHESHSQKKVKKAPSVRFAPETSVSSENRIFLKDDGNSELGTMSDDDIRTEIYSYLPSNTLSRKRLLPLSSVAKAYTLPHTSVTRTNDIPMKQIRHRSVVAKRKSSFLSSLGQLSETKYSFDYEIDQDLTDDVETCLTEEEKRKELSNIRNIPVRLSEKKKYREAILETLPLHKPRSESCWSKFSDLCSYTKRICESFELWNATLKRIEGHHGTGVVSYFVFLRWLIVLNLILFLLCFFFVTLPHIIFPLSPLKDIRVAPNSTIINEEFLNRFPDPKSIKPKAKQEIIYSKYKINNEDILSNLGTLFDHYSPDKILDFAFYDKRNFTTSERHNISLYCETRYANERKNRSVSVLSVMQDLLQGTGWLESTILFLGYYPPNDVSYFGLRYSIPVAIIAVLFFVFLVCLFMMLQYSSHGVQETILARKSNYLAYSNILFCSWDYCIEDRKSSIIRHNSILHEIKSTLIEERRKREIKQWSKAKKTKVYCLRTFINIFVLSILCACYYLIYRVVNYQLKELQMNRLNSPGVNTLLVQYMSAIVITGLNIFVPIIFTNIVKYEMYNTQTQINIALVRIVFLRLSSVFVLVGMLYQQITCEPKDMCLSGISPSCRSPLCWETYVGQQLYKLAVTDFLVYMVMFLFYDLPRDIIVRRCKNKVTEMIGRQIFDLPNQVLALVYSQTLCWLGVIYSPLLPAITVMKFVILFHLKKVMVLKYCVPAPISYKASRSNAMFMMILMLSFFSLIIIHGYSLTSIEPSPACSPFRYYFVMVESIPDALFSHLPTFAKFMNFLFSGLFFIPAIILMCIAIYYYWTIVVAHRKMVKVLKAQIVLEGRDKQFLLNRLTEAAKGHFS